MAAGIAVGIAVVLVACVCYFVVRGQLRGQVDDALRAQATAVERGFQLERPLPGISASVGGPAPYAQLVLADAHDVPLAQLASAAGLRLAVDERGFVGEQRLDLAAAVNDAGELEQLPEPDRVAVDRDLARHFGECRRCSACGGSALGAAARRER